MLRKLLCVVFFCSVLKVNAQVDSALQSRLTDYLYMNQTLNFEDALDLVYPRVFALIPRNEMQTALQSVFESEDNRMGFDSMWVDTIYPPFIYEEREIVKIDYQATMFIEFLDENAFEDSTEIEQMVAIFEEDYGKGNVKYDKETNKFLLRIASSVLGVKDDASPEWTFVSYEQKSPMVGILFGDKLIEKLALYK